MFLAVCIQCYAKRLLHEIFRGPKSFLSVRNRWHQQDLCPNAMHACIKEGTVYFMPAVSDIRLWMVNSVSISHVP